MNLLNQNVKNYMQSVDVATLKKCLQARDMALEFEAVMKYDDTLLSDSAYVYDIGMRYISSTVTNKIEPLTKTERDILNLHSYIGYQILKELEVEEKICQMILFHHSTHPVSFGDIPACEPQIKARRKQLFGLDAYIGLTSDRTYRKRYSHEDAIKIMEHSGGHDEDMLQFLKNRI